MCTPRMRCNKEERERENDGQGEGPHDGQGEKENFDIRERESAPMGCIATKAKRERAMAMGREEDSIKGKMCAPSRYVTTNRREKDSMPRRKKASRPREK